MVSRNVHSRIYDILPVPFDLIEIPAGIVVLVNNWDDNRKVYLKKDQPRKFDVPAFAIAKYPVTNAQFAKFIEAKGYEEKKWWTKEGWQSRTRMKWMQPRFWEKTRWNQPQLPVVGISWYEAVAFCAWLSEASGEKIVLPTEQQWQRAAQGDDNRTYPWGNDWSCYRCNNSVYPCDSEENTAVTRFEGKEKGDSPFGAVDMAGNVWEMCLSSYLTGRTDLQGTDVRVLRGGSWYLPDPVYYCTYYRRSYSPEIRNDSTGFRFARV